MQKGIVWVNLPELPLEFYKNDILTKIGNSIGKTIKIDAKSLEGGNKRFACLCILVDATIKPPKRAWIGKSLQDLVYEEGHWYCGSCNSFGHAHNSCQKNQKVAEQNQNEGGRNH